MTNKIVTGYWSTNDLMERFKISKTTLWRWMNRENNPLPKPRLNCNGSQSKWAIDDVVAWENSMGQDAA